MHLTFFGSGTMNLMRRRARDHDSRPRRSPRLRLRLSSCADTVERAIAPSPLMRQERTFRRFTAPLFARAEGLGAMRDTNSRDQSDLSGRPVVCACISGSVERLLSEAVVPPRPPECGVT
jgi:hypothetical protein